MTLGRRVRAERERQGLSQAHLAGSAGLSLRTVEGLEAGRNPTLATVAAIANGLGLAVTDLLLAGPEQLDLAFGLPEGLDLGPLATIEARILRCLPSIVGFDAVARVAVWPWGEPGDWRGHAVTGPRASVVLRAPASLTPILVTLTGSLLAVGQGAVLSAPIVRPVAPSGSLRVLVRAPSRGHAQSVVLRETTAAGCCPDIRVTGRRPLETGSGWLATLLGVPASASAVLQRLRVVGPVGLFVPA